MILKKIFLKPCLLLCLIVLIGCANNSNNNANTENEEVKLSPVEELPDNKAGSIVRKAIEYAGGWNDWLEKKTLTYTKEIQFFDSVGNLRREVIQLHQYQLQPQLKMRMTWQDNGDKYTIINNGQEAWKLKNGVLLTGRSDVNSAWNSSFGSQYTMCMPFKLTDPGVVLTYEGLDTLANSKVVHSIKVNYLEGAGSSAGYHTWWYYFNKDNYELAANFLNFGNGFSYTQYEEFLEQDGIKLNKERHSYHADKDRDLLYLSSTYKNKDVQFNLEFEESFFELPE